MDIGSLLIMLALCGQAQSSGADDRQAAPADLDTEIEAADQSAEVNADEPAAKKSSAPPRASATNDEEPSAADGDLTPTRNVVTNPAAPEALLQWLAQADTSLSGKRVTLVDLLSRVYDRPQQAIVIPAYWKLAAAEYDYRIAADEAARLQQLLPQPDATGKHPTDPLLEARFAAAEARLREAELAVIGQQHALADQMRLPANEPLPLTSDLPHAGAYRTFFQERYVRVAPPRAYLIDKTLPILNRSIELRAEAAVSAADCAEAGTEAYRAGQLDLASTVGSIAELTRQRRAFVAAVRDYNLDIADYALSVVPANLTSTQLVSILIGPPPATQGGGSAGSKQAPADRGGVNQAGFNAPLFAPAGQPTMAPLRQAPNLPAADDGLKSPPPSARPPRRAPRPDRAAPNQSGDAPHRIKSTAPSSTSRRDTSARRHVVGKPPSKDEASATGQLGGETSLTANDLAADQGFYTALRDLSSVKRAQELSATLHWTNSSAEPLGTATTLIEALNGSVGLDRRTVVQAYWRACEEVAALQVTKQEAELLRALESAALGIHAEPGGAEAMLHLRTSRLAAQAAAEESMAGMLNAQFALAQLMRRPLEGPWPLCITPPHAGGYRLKLDAQPATVLQSSAVRQLAAALPLEHDALQAHADAVVAADAGRVEAVLGFEAGQRRLDEVVESIGFLSSETLAFLDVQTNYNLHFADYVLSVAPPGIGDSTLAGVLVVAGR